MRQIGWGFGRKKDEKLGKKGIIALFSFVLIIMFALVLVSALVSASAASPGSIVNADFNTNIGVVGTNFYGVNVHNSWLQAGRMIDTNGDGSVDTTSDTTWNRNTFVNGGYTYAREDMNLNGYYDGWYNGDAEQWLSTSANTNSDTEVEDAPYGWYLETSTSSGGSVSRSSDAHSGSYSVNLVASSSHGEWNFKDVNFKAGHTYTFSVWVKSSDSVDILIQSKAGNWNDVCSASSSGSGGWEQISCTYTPSTNVAEGYRLPIVVNAGESTLWDDATLTDDGNPMSWWQKGDLSGKLSEYAWAQANNVRILNVISYMPKFLADLNSGCTTSGILDGCAPNDYNKFGEIVKDYVDRSTNNGQYLSIVDYEDWNEPDTGLLGDYASSDQRKADVYVKIHTAIRNALKAAYPNVCLGGTGSSWFEDGPLINSYFSNFKDDCFFSFHIYESPLQVNLYTKMTQYYNAAIADCNSYGANCSRIIISEYNLDHTSGDDLIRNTLSRSNEYAADYSLFYASTLNSFPGRISLVAYQWADQYLYGSGNFPEYPHQWDTVIEPAMGLSYKPPYNVTDDFSAVHSPGSMIVKSNSSLTNVRIVASKKNGGEHIIVINTGSATDVGVNVYGLSLTGLQDIKTGQIYSASNGYVYIGNIDQFAIRYFVGLSGSSPVNNPPVNNTVVNNPPVNTSNTPVVNNTTNTTVVNNSTNTTTTNTTSTSGGSSSGSTSGSGGSSGGSSSGGSSGSSGGSTTTNNTVKTNVTQNSTSVNTVINSTKVNSTTINSTSTSSSSTGTGGTTGGTTSSGSSRKKIKTISDWISGRNRTSTRRYDTVNLFSLGRILFYILVSSIFISMIIVVSKIARVRRHYRWLHHE